MENFVIPDELKILLAMGITYVVTQALKFLSEKVGEDLSGYTAQVAAALVASVLVVINAAVSNVPVEFLPVVNQLLALLVVVLGATGLYKKLHS
jgi:hypothetical protein